MCNLKYFLLVVFGMTLQETTEGFTAMLIKKFEMCDAKYDYPVKLETSIKTRDNIQYVNITATVNTPLGQNQFMNISIDYSKTGKNFRRLFKASRSELCDFLNKDLGPFWFDLQKQMAIPPRTCPLGVGRYNLRDYELPFYKLAIMNIPTGILRSYTNIVETGTDKIMLCVYFLVEVR